MTKIKSKKENKIGNLQNSNNNTFNQQIIEEQNNLQINNITVQQNNKMFSENMLLDYITRNHPLYPHFITGIDKFDCGITAYKSIPNEPNALINYPLSFKSNFVVSDERYKSIKNRDEMIDILLYADSPVEIKVNSFKQFLGDFEDPHPNPDFDPTNKNVVKTYIMPTEQKLPKMDFKVKFVFDDSDFKLNTIHFKYVKRKIGNELIFNNYHQNCPIHFQMSAIIQDDKSIKCNFTPKINENKKYDSHSILLFNQYALNVLTKSLTVINIDNDITWFNFQPNKKASKEEIESIERYSKVIERIIAIEKYANVKLKVEDEIQKDDIDTINELYRYIMFSKKRTKCNDLKFSLLKKNANFKQVKDITNKDGIMIANVSSNVNFNILNTDIHFDKITEKYLNIKLDNKKEIQKIIDNWDNIDDETEIKLIFISAKGKKFDRTIEIIKDEKDTD